MRQLSQREMHLLTECLILVFLIGLLPWAWVDVLLALAILLLAWRVGEPESGEEEDRTLAIEYQGVPLNEIGLRHPLAEEIPIEISGAGTVSVGSFEFELTEEQADAIRRSFGLVDEDDEG